MRMRSIFVSTLCAVACAWLAASAARAQTPTYHVALNTSGMAASSAGPFALDFQFNDGGAPGNNTVTLTHFDYGGGSAASVPDSVSGGASGNANSAVVINDTALLNELAQTFTPGTALTFDVSMTNNANTAPGSSPDEFSFALLDGSGNEIVTTAASGAFLTIDTDPAAPVVTTAGTPAGAALTITAPQVQAAAVPEAGSVAWLVSMGGVFGVGLRLRRGGVSVRSLFARRALPSLQGR